MTSFYNQLVEKLGEEGAKEHMRSIRATDKPAGGLYYASKKTKRKVARLGGKASSRGPEKETDTPPISQEG